MEQHWRLVLHVTCVIEPHAVDPSDRFEEIEDKAIPDEAGPSGGAGGSGGSAAAGEYTSANRIQTVEAYQVQEREILKFKFSLNAMNENNSANAAWICDIITSCRFHHTAE